MSVHAPAPDAPAVRREFRAEHLTAIVTMLLVIFAIGAGTNSLPDGKLVGTTCAWHGSRLVVSGGLINTGTSSAQFRVSATIRIAGRPRAIFRSAYADLAGFSAGRWGMTYANARKGLVGNTVGCTTHVRTYAPPSRED